MFLVAVAEQDEAKDESKVVFVDNPAELGNLLHSCMETYVDLFDFNVSLVMKKYVDHKDIDLDDDTEFDDWFWKSDRETKEMLKKWSRTIQAEEGTVSYES